MSCLWDAIIAAIATVVLLGIIIGTFVFIPATIAWYMYPPILFEDAVATVFLLEGFGLFLGMITFGFIQWIKDKWKQAKIKANHEVVEENLQRLKNGKCKIKPVQNMNNMELQHIHFEENKDEMD